MVNVHNYLYSCCPCPTLQYWSWAIDEIQLLTFLSLVPGNLDALDAPANDPPRLDLFVDLPTPLELDLLVLWLFWFAQFGTATLFTFWVGSFWLLKGLPFLAFLLSIFDDGASRRNYRLSSYSSNLTIHESLIIFKSILRKLRFGEFLIDSRANLHIAFGYIFFIRFFQNTPISIIHRYSPFLSRLNGPIGSFALQQTILNLELIEIIL